MCSSDLTRLAAAGSAVGVLLGSAAVWVAGWRLTEDLLETAAVAATASLLLLGLLPRIALTTSRLFRLDSQVMAGAHVERRAAAVAVASAHWSLAASVAVVATSFGAAGWLLGRQGGLQPWPLGLTAVLALAWALRARHFPLAVERLMLWASAVLPPLGVAAAVVRGYPAVLPAVSGALVLAGVLIALLGTRSMSEYTGAQMRRAASRLESTCVLLVLPVLLGVFGVYGDLLTTFGS